MEIKVNQQQGRVPVAVFHVSGNIDSNTYGAFEQQAKDAIQAGARYILLDLTNVPFMSSAGLRAMHEVFLRLREAGEDVSEQEMLKGISAGTYKSPYLKLLNANDGVKRALQMAGFDMYLEIHSDFRKAIASF